MNTIDQRRKKVLLTSLSGQLGGMELRLADEARHLRSIGHIVEFAVSPFPGSEDWTRSLVEEGFTQLAFSPPPFIEEWKWHRWNFLKAAIFDLRILRRARPDLAHVFYAWTLTGGSRLWLCHKAGIPTVLSVHNTFPSHLLSGRTDRLMRAAFRSVRGIYGVSQSALDHFVAIYGDYVDSATKLAVIHNFVDTNRFVPSPERRARVRAELGIPPDAPLLGSIGRIDTQKQPFAVLSVLEELRAKADNIHLLFVGGGGMAGALQDAVRDRGLERSVRILGFQNDVERYFAAIDIHLLLSKQEGFGISTVEAMSCGVPVVATDVPGTRDILAGSQAGGLVPFGQWSEAAAQTWRLLSDKVAYVQAGNTGREEAIAKFSRARWESELTSFYESVLNR